MLRTYGRNAAWSGHVRHSGAPVQIGYKPRHPTTPTSTNINKRLCRLMTAPVPKVLVDVVQRRYISKRSSTTTTATTRCPRRAGRSPGWPTPAPSPVRWGWRGVWHPADLPKGYHAAPRGQAWDARPAASRDAAPGEPRGRAMPDRRDATRLPACKICGYQASDRRHDLRCLTG